MRVVLLILLLLAINTSNSNPVDLDDLYNLYFPLTASAASKTPEKCAQSVPLRFGQITITQQFNETCLSTERQLCRSVLASVNDTNILVFQGSEDLEQIDLIGKLSHRQVPFLKENLLVSSYFSLAFERAYDRDAVGAKMKSGNRCVFLGYSLGGALATLAALHHVNRGDCSSELTTVVTFGTPRVGNAAFADFLDVHIPHKTRVIMKADPIPHSPFRSYGSAEYRHGNGELWFQTGAQCTPNNCTGQESDVCSNSLLQDGDFGWYNSVQDHLFYLLNGIDVSSWGVAGCPSAYLAALPVACELKKHFKS